MPPDPFPFDEAPVPTGPLPRVVAPDLPANRHCFECKVGWRAQYDTDNACWVCGENVRPELSSAEAFAEAGINMDDAQAWMAAWGAAYSGVVA